MKHIFSFLCLLCVAAFCHAQSHEYFYHFNKDLDIVDKPQAIYKGVGIIANDALEFKLYTIADSRLLSLEHYTDSSLKIEHGLFEAYNNNNIMSRGSYNMGKKEGAWIAWDSAGRVTDSSIYVADKMTYEAKNTFTSKGTLANSRVTNILTGEMESISYNDDGSLWSNTIFKGNDGIEKRYEKGVLYSSDTVHTREEIEAEFVGGNDAWRKYIGEQFQKHGNELIKDGQTATCRVRFIIDTDGKPREVKAISMEGTVLARIAVNAIKFGPKWKPASQYGRPVKAFREQPVTFNITEE